MPQIKNKSATLNAGKTPRQFTCTMSKEIKDRDGEVLILSGMDLSDFKANPVLLFVHDSRSIPVGKVLEVVLAGDELVGLCEFAERPESHPAEAEWLPDTLAHLVSEKCLNAVSMGFMVKEIRPANDDDIKEYGAGTRYILTKTALAELSVVPVPCNQAALIKMKGLKSDAIIPVADEPPDPPAKKHTVILMTKKKKNYAGITKLASVRAKGGLYV